MNDWTLPTITVAAIDSFEYENVLDVWPVTGRERTKNLKTLMMATNGAILPATKNTAPDKNGASYPEPRLPLTAIPNLTIETKVHNTIWYKDETKVRI